MRSSFLSTSFLALAWTPAISAACYEPSPAFPPPAYESTDPILLGGFSRVQASLASLINSTNYNTTSFSIQVTSTQYTLWSAYHTAREQNSTRPGANEVQGDSAFRIASITKTFTTLALLQLHSAGKLTLDDPVTNYLPNLTGTLPWKDITLRILASQLSGLPRDWTGSQGDLSTEMENAWRFGLPPTSHDNPDLPNCYSYGGYGRPCGEGDLYQAVRNLKPVFAPNFKSTYSNMAFEVLGLVIANVSGMEYETYIQKNVLDIIGMNSSSFKTPPDEVAVLPKGNAWFWDVDEGIHNPTGGLYSTADDLSLYQRYILTHFNALAPGINWLQPHSFAFGGESFYGMPWEIFSTTKMLEKSERPVTFFTKGGGEPGYVSNIILVPDYGLAFTILVAGADESNGEVLGALKEAVTVPIIRAAEKMVEKQMKDLYAGTFVFETSDVTEDKLNSSLKLSYSEMTGLVITDWISNGTDVMKAFQPLRPSLKDPRTRVQLLPTLLYENEIEQKGEKWRLLITPARKNADERGVWDEFCITDVDIMLYNGNPINELTLYVGDDGKIQEVHLSAFRVMLKRQDSGDELLVQEL